MGLGSMLSNIKLPAGLTKAKVLIGKHSPEILVATGVVLVVGSAVVACKQTIKATDIIKDANNTLDTIKDNETQKPEEEYSAADARKDRTIVYAQTGAKLLKCYGPSIVFGAVGIGMIIGSHKILKNRNATLTVAYTNLLNSFNSYRKRIAEHLGEDEERFLASGSTREDITMVDEEGNETTIENAIVHDDGTGHSPYARLFDESNPRWNRNPTSNLLILKSAQKWANDKLQSEGVLFLNDVYRELGFPRTQDGQIVGWVYDPKREIEGHYGDNVVDFGIYDLLHKHQPKIDFINGYEPSVWLDFNVDGVVYDLI